MAVQSKDYFKLPGLPWMLLIGSGICMLLGATFFPSAVPYGYLGPLGTFLKFLQENHPSVLIFLNVFMVACHFMESLYCMQMCGRKNISQSCRVKWFMATMAFGGASLYKLSQLNKPASKNYKD